MTANALLKGSLKNFNLVEVLQVMELGSMTGAINLKQGVRRSAIIYFNQGKMANCAEFDADALTLGDVLQQLKMATSEQIEHAFSQQLHDVVGKRIGERLISMNVIVQQQLREALRTKALWTARELSTWHDGDYEFIASPDIQKLLPYGETPLDIEVMRVTMEMVRYTDEWTAIKEFLPQGMQTMLQMSSRIPHSAQFYTHTVELFTKVNRFHKVRRVACAMQTPELDIARELAQLVQQNYLLPMPSLQSNPPPDDGRRVRLPNPAEKLRLEHFQLLNLLSRMEQAWERHPTPMGRLPIMVEFINWTMEELTEACRVNGTVLDSNTLHYLLANENLYYLGNYQFQVNENHIDVESFTALCDEVLNENNDLKKAHAFYEGASISLQRMLSHIFETINARVADPQERVENQEVWEAMFQQFAEQV